MAVEVQRPIRVPTGNLERTRVETRSSDAVGGITARVVSTARTHVVHLRIPYEQGDAKRQWKRTGKIPA